MPLFTLHEAKLERVGQSNFRTEKELQGLIEANLDEVFKCRLVATEFSTGAQHAGRIDTLALSEESHPVILEYKKIESSSLINQGLFYLAWLHDHRGDFEVAARSAIGDVEIDWSSVRVICIAPTFQKYDLYAAQVMGANLELWTYRLFENQSLYLEEVLRSSLDSTTPDTPSAGLTAGQKAAITRQTGSYTFEEHVAGKPAHIREIALSAQEFILSLDPSIQEAPKKFYVAYKATQNIVCMDIQKKQVLLFLKLDPKETQGPSPIFKDLSEVGHYGTGDFGLYVKTVEEFDTAKPFIEMAYQRIGG